MKTYWISRDLGPNGLTGHVKVWDKEPKLYEPNGCWGGKIFMGMFDVEDFHGANSVVIEKGQCKEMTISFCEKGES